MLLSSKNIVYLLLLLAGLYACTQEQEELALVEAQLEAELVLDVWRLSRYEQAGSNNLYAFSEYVFSFATDGGLTAVRPQDTYSGNWNTVRGEERLFLQLSFPSSSPFAAWNGDWQLQAQSDTEVQLQRLASTGERSYLTFRK